MSTDSKAIETTGVITDKCRLLLDEPVPIRDQARVRVIILYPEDDVIDEKEWLKAAAKNPAFASLNEPEENIYRSSDGRPFRDTS